MLISSIRKTLKELSDVVSMLSDEEYCCPCQELSNATIGQHTRHIIELFQCLETQYQLGTINYDQRNRDALIQTNTAFAYSCIATIMNRIDKPDKPLLLQQYMDGDTVVINTNYHRELLYNLEHCIHHQALIKVALLQIDSVKVDDNFGVARSTIEYRKQCAQ
ncbi:DinB family protein [Flavobacterium sp.]|uniref:DinB family protein n=1 Tax=Flavobacterium sp. TaxID=239 RepID=UPI002FDE0983